MFCGECGAKNNNKDAFCSECGAPLVHEETSKQGDTTNVVKTPKQPMSKKNKIIIAIVAVVVVLLGIGYKVGSDATDPKKVAEDYIQATISQDGDKLYKYLEIEGDKTFVNKKVFKNLLKDNKSDTSKIENYKITDVEYGEGKLTAEVKFTYTMKGSSKEKTSSINLIKEKEKKLLLFDNWKVSEDLSSTTIEDFTIKATKGSTVTYAGIKLTSKYLDKDESTSKLDVYVLPQVFTVETKVKAILPNGMEIEDEVTPSSYRNSFTISFDEDNLSSAAKEKITTKAKSALTTVYTNAISKKAFSEFKSSFEHGKLDLSKFETNYTSFLSDLEDWSTKLTSIEFTNVSIYDAEINEDGNLEVEVKANYDYSVTYTNWSDEVKTHEDSDYSYMTVVLAIDKNEYYVIDAYDLEDYFSKY